MVGISNPWLPEGHHWDLHIERNHAPNDAGPFTPDSAGWKFLIHITVSPWGAVDSMVNVLNAKRAQPHLVLGGRRGLEHPVLVQLLPFDVAGRSLQNDPSDGRQTNRAKVIQLEICANPGTDFRHLAGVDERAKARAEHGTDLFALNSSFLGAHARRNVSGEAFNELSLCLSEPPDDTPLWSARRAAIGAFHDGVGSWTDETYKALGNVFELVRHRVPIPNKLARKFTDTRRFTDKEFEEAEGLEGHMHAPDNTHIDPTIEFKGSRMVHFTSTAPNKL